MLNNCRETKHHVHVPQSASEGLLPLHGFYTPFCPVKTQPRTHACGQPACFLTEPTDHPEDRTSTC